MEVTVGDVIYYDNNKEIKYVIVDFENFEDIGSCGYDRYYYLIPLEELLNKKFLERKEGIKVNVCGCKLPFEKIENEAPFELKRKEVLTIRRKTAKIITIYE